MKLFRNLQPKNQAVILVEKPVTFSIPRPTDRERAGSSPLLCRVRVLWSVSERKTAEAVAIRRSAPIHAYVGPNGGGKSLCMIQDSLPSLAAGRHVLSTVALLDPTTGEPHKNYERFFDWDQLLDARDCDVLMDEMVGVASSRESHALPVQVQNILVQLRRRNVVLRWSAPNWARADKIVREVTQAVTECRGYFPDRRIAQTADTSSGVQLWAPRRLFAFRTYDTIEFEEWTAGKREKAQVQSSQWFYGPGSVVFDSYDTLDAVSMVGDPDAAGTCAVCGGHRPRKRCTCESTHGHATDELRPRRGRRSVAFGTEAAEPVF